MLTIKILIVYIPGAKITICQLTYLISKVAKKKIQGKVNGMPIRPDEAYKYLGFTIDSTLSLNTHINTVIRTVNAKLNTLMQTRKPVGEKTALLYKTLILPILEYNSCLFTLLAQHQKDKLQRLQNRGLQILFKANTRESTDNLHLKGNIPRISSYTWLFAKNTGWFVVLRSNP